MTLCHDSNVEGARTEDFYRQQRKATMNKFLSSALALALVIVPNGLANAATCTVDGVTYTYQVMEDKTAWIMVGGWDYCVPAIDASTSGELTLPSKLDGYTVTAIGGDAFYGCTNLTSVTIPDSVTYISSFAFYGCSRLTSVMISDSVERIAASAFSGCAGLTSITIPNSITNIGNRVFADCTGLTSITIPKSVKSMGSKLFDGCKNLSAITLENGLENIGESAFEGLTSLTSIKIPDSIMRIGKYAFRGCTKLTSVTIPDGVTDIGDYAFYECVGIESVSIPSSITNFGYCVFCDCSNLVSVTLPEDLGCIWDSAFLGCTGLTSLTIPDGVTYIGDRAFRCSGLESVTIPGKVTSIGDQTFYWCRDLVSITMPNSITNIGWYAFELCRKLASITIPPNVTNIKGSAFKDCTSLTNVVFEGAPPTCAEDAFKNVTSNGRYHAKYATEWKSVLDADDKWNGLKMMPLEVMVFPTATTDTEVAAALADAKDERLTANVTTVAKYEKYQAWVDRVAGASNLVARQKVLDSSLAWFAYALNLDALPDQAPESITIDSIDESENGAWNLSVSIADLKVGDDADPTDLEMLFSVEGTTDLSEGAFNSDNVKTTFGIPQNGRIKVSIEPKDISSQFFIRVRMAP